MNRIISKEKEREKIQGEILQRPHSNSNPRASSIFQHSTRTPSVSTHTAVFYINSTYRINSTTRKLQRNYNYKAHPVQINTRLPPVTPPHASKHSTRQNKAPGSPCFHSIQVAAGSPGSSCELPVLPVNSTRQKVHSKQQPTSTETLQDTQAHSYRISYRILQGEIGFFQKG